MRVAIPGSRSRLSISPEYVLLPAWIAGGGAKGGGDYRPDPAPFPANDGTPSPPADDRHSGRWRTQNGRGEGTGKRDRGSATAIGPWTTGRGITAISRAHPASDVNRLSLSRGVRRGSQTPLDNDNRLTSLAGWAREMAGSGRVSGAVAHLFKSRHAARRRDAIADRMLGMGDHRPAVGRSRTISRHCGRSAHLMSAVTRL